jgi:hypothetical protein
MPWLPFFIAGDDLPVLIDRFNRDEEIAYIVKDGPDRPGEQRWRAVRSVETLAMGEHVLWHVPTGPLPMLDLSEPGPRTGFLVPDPDPPIRDPFAGWTQPTSGPFESPYFGPAHPGVMRLTLWTRHLPYTHEERATRSPLTSYWIDRQQLVASDIQFGGYEAPPDVHKRWYGRLKTWMARAAVKLEADGLPHKFYAFPFALALLKQGMPYQANGWRLDAAIAEATWQQKQQKKR